MMRQILRMTTGLIFTLCILLSCTQSTHAIVTGDLTIYPENPSPNQDVYVTFISYSFDIDQSMYVWTINGDEFASGRGKRKVKVNAGAAGERKLIKVVVTTPNNEVVSSGIMLSPAPLEIVWESLDSYTRAGYEGRSLPSEESLVRVSVFPQFTKDSSIVSPEEVAYSWSVNEMYVDGYSGGGKSTNDIKLDPLDSETVIKVIARYNGQASEKTITITPHSITPVFYKKDLLTGVNMAIAYRDRIELTTETTLVYTPYFLSDRFSENAIFSWSMDGLPITPNKADEITLAPRAGAYGARNLQIYLEHAKKKLQTTKTNIQIIFDSR